MNSFEYKILQFHKRRNKLVYEAHHVSDLVVALQKLYDDVYSNYLRKCDSELFDEDFELYSEQLEILWKDNHYYSKLATDLPHTDFVVLRFWNQPITQ